MNSFLGNVIDLSFLKKLFFFKIYYDWKSKVSRGRNEGTRNLFGLKKEQNNTAVKNVRIFFRLKKNLKELKIYYLEILRVFLSMKMKKKIINQ